LSQAQNITFYAWYTVNISNKLIPSIFQTN